MYNSTYLRLYNYIEIGIVFSRICCRTVWATKPLKNPEYQKWPEYQ